jgi:hypothetical protein
MSGEREMSAPSEASGHLQGEHRPNVVLVLTTLTGTLPFARNGDLHRLVIDAGHYQPPAVDVVRIALEVD